MEIRDALEKAAEQLNAATPDVPEAEPAAPAQEPAAAAAPEAEPTAATQARARDGQGRFAKAGEQPPAAAKAGETPAAPPAPPSSPASPEPPKPTRAPQSWSPAVREKFATLPPDVQEHVIKREGEVTRALQESADARRFHEQFRETVRPFEPFMAAAGHQPLESIRNLMQTAAALQTAPPVHKAQIVASIIDTYGVPLEAINAALGGQPMRPQQMPVDPRVIAQQVERSMLERVQQQQQARLAQTADAAMAKARTELEFFEDIGEQKIRNFAASLLEADDALTVDAALREAHDVLASRSKALSAILAQRKAAQAAANAQASTQRLQAAASSVRSSPAAAVAAQPKGERAALHAAAEKIGFRR